MRSIPQYLQDYALRQDGKDTQVRFSIACTCGNSWLEVYENCLSEEDQRQAEICEKACRKLACGLWGATSIPGAEGKLHHWKFLSPFGMKGPKKEIMLPPMPAGSLIAAVQCRCPRCGTEFTLFDSRYHGYDAIVQPPGEDLLNYTPQFKLLRKKCCLEVKVTYESAKDDSNAFDWINIFAISEKGKRATIFGWETA